MFEYSINDVKKDIVAHLSAGSFPYCALPSYASRLKAELSEDFKTLMEISQADDYAVMAFFLEDYLDFDQGRKVRKPVFKTEEFYQLCRQTFGNDFEEVIKDTEIIHNNGEFDLLKAADKCAGRCYTNRDNSKSIIVTTLTNQNPLISAKVMYHEFGHALHRRRNYFKDDGIYQTISRFNKELKEAPQDNKLKYLLHRCHSYKSMLHECYANTFAMASLLTKTKADKNITRRLLNQSAAAFITIMEDPDANPAYCDFPITLKISEKIAKDFANGNTAFYHNPNGSINFKNLANMSAAAVKAMAYDKGEYFDFSDFSWLEEAQKAEASKNEDYKFYNDYQNAKKYLAEHKSKPSQLNALSSLLQQLRHQKGASSETSLEEYARYGIADHINEIRLETQKNINGENKQLPKPLSLQQVALLNRQRT